MSLGGCMNQKTEIFSFVSSGLDQATFEVFNFQGEEGLSQLYSFEINLVSDKPDIDLEKIMGAPAVFSILRVDTNKKSIHGILKKFEVLHAVGHHVFYRAVLGPTFWQLTLSEHNQIFLDKSLPEIIEEVLKDGGMSPNEFELRLQNTYTPKEYVCQYRESHFNFVTRLMEHEGLYYFFEHGPSISKMIITDTKLSHGDASSGDSLHYQPPSGLETTYEEDRLKSFTCRRTPVPKSIRIKDYNYLKPTATPDSEAELSAQGTGQMYFYGENVKNSEEGRALAKIRAEEYQCREEEYFGSGTTSFLTPGFLFTLEHHFRGEFNRKYLVTGAKHQGFQATDLTAGLAEFSNEQETEMRYQMDFSALPADVQFRPPRLAEKTAISWRHECQNRRLRLGGICRTRRSRPVQSDPAL